MDQSPSQNLPILVLLQNFPHPLKDECKTLYDIVFLFPKDSKNFSLHMLRQMNLNFANYSEKWLLCLPPPQNFSKLIWLFYVSPPTIKNFFGKLVKIL